ncbi:MAG TPA: Gfo/Idh/MocA family oxidoreductase [Bryobacteraceae bacterium]|nr:Gfo/Idh/MocA family oxidoreductase [Bryobacteraceae bacterium]
MNRRTLFRSALVLPAALVRATAANSAPTVGLIGAGERGSFVAGLIARHTPARIVALCDVVEGKAAKTAAAIGAGAAHLYDDYRRLLASDVDAVVIATPVFLHAEHFEAAVRAGKHIYIEKPAAADIEGCKRIMRVADGADRRLHITFGFQRRYGQLYLKAHQLVSTGSIGEIQHAHAHFIKSGGAAANAGKLPPSSSQRDKVANWHAFKELSGDLIVENNVHSIDVLNWFIGKRPVSAVGSGGATRLSRGDMRDHNFVAFEYAGGIQAQLSGTTLAPPGYRHVVEQFFGTRGMIETSENHFRHFRAPGQETVEKAPRSIAVDSVADFITRITEKRPENHGVRGAESTLTAILGRMAMDRRGEVTWEEMMRG